jgi:hypothetical protein
LKVPTVEPAEATEGRARRGAHENCRQRPVETSDHDQAPSELKESIRATRPIGRSEGSDRSTRHRRIRELEEPLALGSLPVDDRLLESPGLVDSILNWARGSFVLLSSR